MAKGTINHNHKSASNKRKRPSWQVREYLLTKQKGCCFYCGLKFDEWFHDDKRKQEVFRHVCWDHLSPYSFSFDSSDKNFVAACARCNAIKTDKVFSTFDEATEFVRNRLADKGYKFAPRRAGNIQQTLANDTELSEPDLFWTQKKLAKADTATLRLKISQIKKLLNRFALADENEIAMKRG